MVCFLEEESNIDNHPFVVAVLCKKPLIRQQILHLTQHSSLIFPIILQAYAVQLGLLLATGQVKFTECKRPDFEDLGEKQWKTYPDVVTNMTQISAGQGYGNGVCSQT